MSYATINCDGSKSPNDASGMACWGFMLQAMNGEKIHSKYGCIGQSYTHNFAEYYAILEALRFCQAHQEGRTYIIKSDSKVAIEQLTGKFACKSENLTEINQACLSILNTFRSDVRPKLQWVPREKNVVADQLTSKAQAYAKKAPGIQNFTIEAWYKEPWDILGKSGIAVLQGDAPTIERLPDMVGEVAAMFGGTVVDVRESARVKRGDHGL